MKKFLWIGGYLDEYLKEEIVSNNGKILSSFISQCNIIQGIENNSDIIFDTINSLRLPYYPIYKKLNIKRHFWRHKNDSEDVYVNYLNIKYLAIYFKTVSLKKEAKKWAIKNKSNDVYVFVFGMHSPYMKAALKVKKIIPSAKLVLINPDLPQFMSDSQSFVRKVLKKIDWLSIQKMYKKFDKHILYSKQMAEFLNLSDCSWTVMEGSLNASNFPLLLKEKTEKNIIMYTGVIGSMYGIRELVQSILELGENYELWLFGAGNLEDWVKELSLIKGNIKYFGYFSDRKKLFEYQRNATLLISLINPDSPVSNYCFPSKIFEYMASGNPVICTKINGIPDEYFKYLIPIYNLTKDEIKDKITYVCGLSDEDKEKIGMLGREFIIKNKDYNVQMKKVLEFLDYEKN